MTPSFLHFYEIRLDDPCIKMHPETAREYGFHTDFAHRTPVRDGESDIKTHVLGSSDIAGISVSEKRRGPETGLRHSLQKTVYASAAPSSAQAASAASSGKPQQ